MGLTVVDKLYSREDFVPLSTHNEQTPSSFFDAEPVLHLHCPHSKLDLAREALNNAPELARLVNDSGADEIEVPDIDVWVSSKFLALSSAVANVSVSIDYHTIATHGQQGQRVVIVLNMASPEDLSNEDDPSAPFHIVATTATAYDESNANSAAANGQANGATHDSPAAMLFKAISACQELNPDPDIDDSDNDDMQDTAPGAGGWITSENMNDFMDGDGNFVMPSRSEPLGQGAGRTRTAADATLEDEGTDESKWQRTD